MSMCISCIYTCIMVLSREAQLPLPSPRLPFRSDRSQPCVPCPPGPGGEIDPRDSWPGGHEARSKFARTGRVLPVATIPTVEEAQEFHNDCGHYDNDVALCIISYEQPRSWCHNWLTRLPSLRDESSTCAGDTYTKNKLQRE